MSEVRDPQIQRLLDRAAIQDCLARYARGMDRHDEELVLSAYFEDAVDHHGQFTGSPRELAAWGADQHESVWDAHQHFLSNVTIEFDGDIAHVETYVMFVQRRRGGGVVDFGGGRYVDRFERRAGDWRIAARVLGHGLGVRGRRGGSAGRARPLRARALGPGGRLVCAAARGRRGGGREGRRGRRAGARSARGERPDVARGSDAGRFRGARRAANVRRDARRSSSAGRAIAL